MEKAQRKAVWSRYQQKKGSTWASRNPVLFQLLAVSTGLSILFSRSIYDCFFVPALKSPVPEED